MSQPNVFEEQSNDQGNAPQNPLDAYVGEGKKFRSVEDLAKSYAESQSFIASLTRENGEIREELQNGLTVREQLEALRNQNQQREQQPPAAPAQPAPTEQRVLQDDELVAKIREINKQDTQAQRASANVNEVSERLVSAYGDASKANQAVNQKAQELGLPVSDLMEQAAKSPKAFYAMIGLNVDARNAPAPRGNVNAEALQTLNPRRSDDLKGYYDDMRKNNPKDYFSPKVQLEIHKAAQENPAAFGINV